MNPFYEFAMPCRWMKFHRVSIFFYGDSNNKGIVFSWIIQSPVQSMNHAIPVRCSSRAPNSCSVYLFTYPEQSHCLGPLSTKDCTGEKGWQLSLSLCILHSLLTEMCASWGLVEGEACGEVKVQGRAFQNDSLMIWCWCPGNGSPELTVSFIGIFCKFLRHSSLDTPDYHFLLHPQCLSSNTLLTLPGPLDFQALHIQAGVLLSFHTVFRKGCSFQWDLVPKKKTPLSHLQRKLSSLPASPRQSLP